MNDAILSRFSDFGYTNDFEANDHYQKGTYYFLFKFS